jgi:hypothetical protein
MVELYLLLIELIDSIRHANLLVCIYCRRHNLRYDTVLQDGIGENVGTNDACLDRPGLCGVGPLLTARPLYSQQGSFWVDR